MKVCGDIQSGNCCKVKLLVGLLEIQHEWIHVSVLECGTQTPEFLNKNPNGKIPVLELEDGRFLSESNAVINFLATGTALLPEDPLQYAKVQQWQFFKQYSHEPFIAVARLIAKFLVLPQERRAEYESKQEGAHKALRVME